MIPLVVWVANELSIVGRLITIACENDVRERVRCSFNVWLPFETFPFQYHLKFQRLEALVIKVHSVEFVKEII